MKKFLFTALVSIVVLFTMVAVHELPTTIRPSLLHFIGKSNSRFIQRSGSSIRLWMPPNIKTSNPKNEAPTSTTRIASKTNWSTTPDAHINTSTNSTIQTNLPPSTSSTTTAISITTKNLSKETHLSKPFAIRSGIETCREITNFIFVKTHKTGSTTLRSLTTRFGYFRNLSFVLGAKSIIGHLNGLRLNLKNGSKNILPPVGVKVGDYDNYKDYNISNIHMVFDDEKTKRIMYNGSTGLKYITILRDPSQQWLSNFQYYKGYKHAGLKLSDLPGKLLPYLKKINESNLGGFNRQMKDLGIGGAALKKMFNNKSNALLNKTVEMLDRKYSLVLITEYFDESLLVLKRLFCWSFEDILYVKQRQQPNPLVGNDEVVAELQRRNWVDEAVYRYFVKVLWRRVEEYGPSFEEDLRTFRELLNKTSETCLAKSVAKVSIDKYLYIENFSVKNNTFCWALVNTKFHMDIEVVRRQGRTKDLLWAKLDF